MITQAKKAVTKRNPGYDLVFKRLHLYYDMKISNFWHRWSFRHLFTIPSIFISYNQSPLILYQIEALLDLNTCDNSYTKIQMSKPYIVLIDKLYLPLRHHELGDCKHIRYDLYCGELFFVKDKSTYSCETAIF